MAASEDAPMSEWGSPDTAHPQPCSGEHPEDFDVPPDAQEDAQLRAAARVDYVLDSTAIVPTPDETRERLNADDELLAALEKFRFTGPAWDLFADSLIRYSAATLDAWSQYGRVFQVLRDHGVRLMPPATQRERRRLAGEPTYRAELVRPAIAAALVKVQRALQAGTGWKPDGGMSLTTYFVGACVFAFANEFRKLRRRDQFLSTGHADFDPDELADDGFGTFLCATPYPDPETTAINNATIRNALHGMSELERAIVWGKVSGYTAAEIAELNPGTTKKAIEQRWARLKEKYEWIDRVTVTRRMS
ncbi:RNA polymerase sigma factor [Nocardia vulneris]|uniref:Sigma-70 family RNA polymerase sigma factor n=1 Tax=Nocardia vulneris TaxID=1141657 RepID=A0ABR4Z7Q2_9NOCA|nr:sigma-70 family RNA polymerase sigma factor [Nocardia vulneris]KIA61372.1 hypothetical protein FG87_31240 [Nocardia vulneris]